MRRFLKPRWLLIEWIVILTLLIVGFHVVPGPVAQPPVMSWGVTFNKGLATYLGMNWKTAYSSMLDDLGVRWLRLETPWSDIEPTPGAFNIDDVRWQLDQAGRRGAKVLLSVGRKLPRWPECYIPDWAAGLPAQAQEVQTLAMVRNVVDALKDHPAIWAWQVENEPLFPFGECPRPSETLYRQEVELVRTLDTRPIVGTDSGELSTWWRMSSIVDILGVSIYRKVYHPILGYSRYPIVPAAYARKAAIVDSRVGRIISTELQMEPWVPAGFLNTPIENQTPIFTTQDFTNNIEYAKKTGFDTVYLWGVEWWAWMKENNHPEYWEAAKGLFKP
ncbi:hypothetical protein HZA86_02970 [Candidatus Uhrbacteria bacterium]|nr:hypothetical protein [Candidatus Uhrbacteria bacterium]